MPDQSNGAAPGSHIPVVDFSCLSLKRQTSELSMQEEGIHSLAEQIYDAFSNIGFVYLKNHGISQDQVYSNSVILLSF